MTKGTVVNNGHFLITLTEDAVMTEDGDRWYAKGRRWVPSRKDWESTAKKYGGFVESTKAA